MYRKFMILTGSLLGAFALAACGSTDVERGVTGAGIGGAAALLQGERHYGEEPPNALSLTSPVYGLAASA